MQNDLGSRSPEISRRREIRGRALLKMAHVSQDAGDECVIMQGSGTFARRESVVSSVVPESGRLLILSNGACRMRCRPRAPDVAFCSALGTSSRPGESCVIVSVPYLSTVTRRLHA
eukprot:2638621-Prymnesium_polylepis.1